MATYVREHANGTSMTYAKPYDLAVSARVMCSDGKVRTTKRLSEPDTFFSRPCAVKAHGKTVTGFLTSDDETLTFRAFTYRKNASILP